MKEKRVIGEEKIFTMKFADDIVLIADHPEGLTSMIKTLEKFVKKNKLSINIEKTKVLIFKKRGKNKKGESWKYNDVQLEIVKEYKLLTVWFSTGNTFEKHIKKNTKKIIMAINAIWGIFKRVRISVVNIHYSF